MLLISTVVVLLHLSFSSAGDPCPSKLALAPCICTQLPVENGSIIIPTVGPTPSVEPEAIPAPTDSSSSYAEAESSFTIVECKVLKSIAELEVTVSNALDRKLVDQLVLDNIPARKGHTLARLPRSGWLSRVRVRQFVVLNSRLSWDFIWNGEPFAGQGMSLLSLTAKKCALTGALTHEVVGTVNTKGINTLPYLQRLDFSENFLTHVQSTAFRYPPANLSHVDLSKNSIEFIETTAFQHIGKLRFMNLSHNLLEKLVGREIFESTAKYLEHIDLSWNLLETLPVEFFIRMPALKIVDLSNNLLYSMPERPWGFVWKQLKFINVTGNSIDCDCNLMWLLPILSPRNATSPTTPAPTALPGQTVEGSCSKSTSGLFAVTYDLVTLNRDRLNC